MRYNKINLIRKKLHNNSPSIGSWQQIPNASISEILGKSGYDWVAVDLEHGSISVEKLPDLFRALELGGTLPIARIAESKSKDCKQALDAGAGGIIAPMIESVEQLLEIRDFCCWPPDGVRGVGFSRANMFGKEFDNYRREARSPLLIAQIESINAVNNIEEIVQVEQLDAIIIGPYDLSASMGITADFENTEFIKTINKIIKVCKKYNMPYGDHVVQPKYEILKQRVEQGYRFIAFSIDSVFLTSICQFDKNIL